MLLITEKAYIKLIEISKKENLSLLIRVGIKSFGCNGFGFDLFFIEENQIKDTDVSFIEKNIRFIIDKNSINYISGTKIDFVNNLLNQGFKFENSDFQNKCGCGELPTLGLSFGLHR